MPVVLPLRSGFQTTTTSAVEVTFYLDDDQDPVLVRERQGAVLKCGGLSNNAREEPMVLRVSTSKAFGSASGNFSLMLAIPDAYGRELPSFEDLIIDDTWLDIVFITGSRRFHTLRGLVSSVVMEESTGAGTQRRAHIEGFDFGRIFERTSIWFNQFRVEDSLRIAGADAEDAFSETLHIFKVPNVAGTPDEAVRRTLYGFLGFQAGKGRLGNWKLPKNMPGRQETFPETFLFDSSGFNPEDPRRVAVSQQFMSPEGQSAWSLAVEWSDPPFCELFCDLIERGGRPNELPQSNVLAGFDENGISTNGIANKGGSILEPHKNYDVKDTSMGVVFRDRPFVRIDRGASSAWFALPTAEVIPQELRSCRLARSGNERYNAFFVSPRVLQNAGSIQALLAPLWAPADIRRHGLRQYSVDSRYIAERADLLTLTQGLRARARDFHCLNPYYFSGTLSFARWRPDIRIGQRVHIREGVPRQDIRLYVESVEQSWTPSGGETTIGVTRGWRGTDESQLSAISRMAALYEDLPGENREPIRQEIPSTKGVGGAGRGVVP